MDGRRELGSNCDTGIVECFWSPVWNQFCPRCGECLRRECADQHAARDVRSCPNFRRSRIRLEGRKSDAMCQHRTSSSVEKIAVLIVYGHPVGDLPLEKAQLLSPLLKMLSEGLRYFRIILLSQCFEGQRHAGTKATRLCASSAAINWNCVGFSCVCANPLRAHRSPGSPGVSATSSSPCRRSWERRCAA